MRARTGGRSDTGWRGILRLMTPGTPTPAVPTALLADRIRRAGDVAAEHGVDLLLVTPGTDLRYLLDAEGASHERLTCLRVARSRAPRAARAGRAPAGGAGLGRPGAGRPRRRGRHLERRRRPLPAGQRPGRRPHPARGRRHDAREARVRAARGPAGGHADAGRADRHRAADAQGRRRGRPAARRGRGDRPGARSHGRVPQGGPHRGAGRRGHRRGHRRGGPHRRPRSSSSARGRTGPARTTTCRTG